MLYRRFGRTELEMPVFSCGGMRYQHKWQDVPLDEVPEAGQKNLEDTIHRALALGINHIETARGYGSSERQLGLVLPKLDREKLIVQTKVGPEDEPDAFLANFEESLERLQLDYVDLLAIHGINDEKTLEQSIRPGGCLAACRELQKEGKARHIGFSTHGPRDVLLKAVRHEEDGGFDYINLHWYFIFQRNWPVIVEARQRDMGVFIISPTDKGGKLYAPPDKLRQLTTPLHPISFNDLFCLSHDEVHTLSIGASSPGDFDGHIDTLDLLSSAERVLPPILDRLSNAMAEAIGEADPEAMSDTLPSWQQMPKDLNAQIMVWLRNLAKGWGMTEYGKMRFNLLGGGSHWFPGAKPEVLDEVSDAEIVAAAGKSPWAEQLPDLLRESRELLEGEAVKRASQGG
ncbi:MAG: aldo/keto reductase [Phycisphaeraceae bacterium]